MYGNCNIVFFVFQDMSNNNKQTYFSDEWLTRNIYSNRIERVPGNGKSAKCKLCKEVIQLSNMGEDALISHFGGDKHKKKIADIKEIQTFFTKGSSSKSTSKTLSETSYVTTITDAVEVIPSNSQKKFNKLLTLTFFLLGSVKLRLFGH